MKRNGADRIRAALAQSPHFRELSPSDVQHLAAIGRVQRLRAGEPCTGGLCVVLDGRLRITSVTAHGHEFVYAYLGRGEFFGLADILPRMPAPLAAHAVGTVVLALFPTPALRRLLDARPLLWRAFAGLLYERLMQTLLLARDVSVAPVPQRLARRLLWQAFAAENGVRAGHLDVHISQLDLARMLGAGRSVVNAELKRLERSGAVKLGYRSVRLLDAPALRRIAGPDFVLP